MRLVYMTLLSLCFMTIGNAQNNPIFSKVTASWCPNCGNWGWSYMEAMKEEFQTGPATLLGVHFSGDLKSDAGVWFANNLNASGQPRFFVNNQAISVGGGNWSTKVETAKDASTEMIGTGMNIISFDGVSVGISGIDINANVNISSLPNTTNEVSVAVYVYENNVENFQSGQGNDAVHPNVLRMALGAPEGTVVTEAGTISVSGDLNADWNLEELGLLAVVYEKVGDTYEIRSSQAISNVASRVSTDELLDANLFSYSDTESTLTITAENTDTYEVTLTNMTGQKVFSNTFENQINIDKAQLHTGMYVSTLRSGNKLVSQQVFVK